jgi:hypothetical protein
MGRGLLSVRKNHLDSLGLVKPGTTEYRSDSTTHEPDQRRQDKRTQAYLEQSAVPGGHEMCPADALEERLNRVPAESAHNTGEKEQS